MYHKKFLIIAFEGPDGTGKSTQIKEVAAALAQKGINVFYQRLPHFFRPEVMNPDVSDEAKILLLINDYRLVVNEMAGKLNNEFGIILLDRIPHISIFPYNLPYCKNIPGIHDILGDQFYDLWSGPDIVVVFNRPPYREADDTFFEQRNDPAKILEYYESFEEVSEWNNNGGDACKVIRLFDSGILSLESNVSDITEIITEMLYNELLPTLSYWNSRKL